jgi:hypothetical protein
MRGKRAAPSIALACPVFFSQGGFFILLAIFSEFQALILAAS